MRNTTAKSASTMVNDQIIKVVMFCACGTAPSSIGAAVSVAGETIADEWLTWNIAGTVLEDGLGSIVVEP